MRVGEFRGAAARVRGRISRARQLCGTAARFDYPSWTTTTTLGQFRAAHEPIESGARLSGGEHEERLAGRISARRDASKKLVFCDLSVGGETLQLICERAHYDGDDAAFATMIDGFSRGDIVGVRGFPGKSGRGELSLIPRELKLLAPCRHALPSASEKEKLVDEDIRFRRRYVDLLANAHSVLPIFLVRARVVRFLRSFLEQRGFVEVETPSLCTSAGGAAARPFTTQARAFGGMPLELRIAPELYLKQLLVGGFERVFELGKAFRNEGVDTTHNPEFTTLEFYCAFEDAEGFMALTEEMLAGLAAELGVGKAAVEARAAADGGAAVAAAGGQEAPLSDASPSPATPGVDVALDIDFEGPYRRLPVVETIEEKLGTMLPNDPPGAFNDDSAVPELLLACDNGGIGRPLEPHTPARIIDHMIEKLIEPECEQPTFIIEHPLCLSPLAKRHPSKPGVTDRFELFIRGSELCNAYSELNDPDEQRARFAQQQGDAAQGDDEAHTPDEDFAQALDHGMPPAAGLGLGVDRLVMLMTGQTSIREVLLFPTMRPRQQQDQTPPAAQ